VRIREGGWSGCVHVNFQDMPLSCLVDPDCLDERRSPFEKVRSSDTAEVYRYSITMQNREESLYLKKFPHRSLADAIRHLFRPSRAKRAFRAALTLEQNGLSTPRIIALLQKKGGILNTEDILVTQGMTNSTALSEVLAFARASGEPASLKNRRPMITAFGQTIARMHTAGICHGDLRWGNIFVSEQNSEWKFYLIDNERTRKYPMLPFWLRRKNLIQLNIGTGCLTQTDRKRFWKAYIQAANISSARSRRIAASVFKKMDRRLRKRSRTHTGITNSASGTHWKVQSAQAGNLKGYLLTSFCRGDKAAAFLKQIETLTETGNVLKNDTATRVVRCSYNNRDIVIKRYNHQGLWHSLRHTIKGSRAMKCWRFGHELTALNIPCAEPIGVVEERKYGLIWQSYILNAFVDGPDISRYLHREDLPENNKQLMLEKTRDLALKLAQNKLIHNDLKPCNLLVHGETPVLIDLDSMQKHHNRWVLSLYKRKMDNKIRERILTL